MTASICLANTITALVAGDESLIKSSRMLTNSANVFCSASPYILTSLSDLASCRFSHFFKVRSFSSDRKSSIACIVCVWNSRAAAHFFAAASSLRVSAASILNAMQSLPKTFSNFAMSISTLSDLCNTLRFLLSCARGSLPFSMKYFNLAKKLKPSSSKATSKNFIEPLRLAFSFLTSTSLRLLANFDGTGAAVRSGISCTTIAFALMPVLFGSTDHIMATYLRVSRRISAMRKKLIIQHMMMVAVNVLSVRAFNKVYRLMPCCSSVAII